MENAGLDVQIHRHLAALQHLDQFQQSYAPVITDMNWPVIERYFASAIEHAAENIYIIIKGCSQYSTVANAAGLLTYAYGCQFQLLNSTRASRTRSIKHPRIEGGRDRVTNCAGISISPQPTLDGGLAP